MNNHIFIATSNDTNDLFNNFEIPAFDAGSQNTTVKQTEQPIKKDVQTNFSTQISFIGLTIGIFLCIVILAKINKRPKQQNYKQYKEKRAIHIDNNQQQTEIEKTQTYQDNNFSTPKNISKCIRLFLENTRLR